MDIENSLKSFGLSQKQAMVYMALLELGSAPALPISRKCGLPRATVYDILADLAGQGVVSSVEQRGVKHFAAESPTKLVQLAHERVRLLEVVLPQLEAVYREPHDRPQARFFRGREGMKMVLEEVLQDKQEMCSFSSSDDLFRILDDYFPRFVERRAEFKIPARVILCDTARGRERKQKGPAELRQVRLIPVTYNFHAMKSIFGRKVAYFAFYRDLVAVVIDSDVISKLERAQFELLWKLLPR